jgi:outer membrane immunogenic protein
MEVAMRNLYSFVSAAALIAGLSGVASAADFPVKAPPIAAAAWSWGGLYLGVHAGGAFGTIESSIAAFPVVSAAINGAFGGGQIGYNFQTGPVVLGVEVDGSGSSLRGTAPCLVILSCQREVNWFGTATARVGFTADRALIYVKGGGAFGEFKYRESILGAQVATGSDTKWGWVIGTGIEYQILPRLSAKVEYNFMDFGRDPVGLTTGLGGTVTIDSQQYIHAVKFGVNYRLGGDLISAMY